MWYEKKGNDTDVILCTKVLIVRNIKGFCFPVKMSDSDKENVIGMVRQAAAGSGNMNFIRTDELDDTAKADLYNNYYSDFAFLNSPDKTGFLLSKKEGVGVLINGKDHINIESMIPGSDVTQAYNEADKIADIFERSMNIAFSEKYGFLTSEIKSTGTGVQIICLAALPGIEKTAGAMAVLTRRLEKYDWTIKAATYGDGKEAGIYQLNSVATLGLSEDDILDKARLILGDVIKLERTCRDSIFKKKKSIIEDQYYRAYATLRYARKIEEPEVFALLGWLRLGQDRINDPEADLDWDRINLVNHITRRNYSDYTKRGRKLITTSHDRAERIRNIVKGDDAK